MNLQNFKRDSYISVICQASDFAGEDRKADADTHLAAARSQNTGTGILGNVQKIKAAAYAAVFFHILERRSGQEGIGLFFSHRIMSYVLAAGSCLLLAAGLLNFIEGYVPESKCREAQPVKKEEELECQVENPDIRVLIMSDGYKNTAHPRVEIWADAGMVIQSGQGQEETGENQKTEFVPDDVRFAQGCIRIRAKDGGDLHISSIQRGCGQPSYSGMIELRSTAEGIVMVNELSVEDYLCRVVPSEMPASYEKEALKAQAVCARSYAYRQMQELAYPEYEAHVNDSTDFQVYGNSKMQESTSSAVEETAGEVVLYQGEIAVTYYYSTSCGRTTGLEAWGAKEPAEYLRSVEVKDEEGDYEKDLPWYRWEAEIPVATLSNLAGLNLGKDLGTLLNVEVTETGPGGVVLQICLTGEKDTATVETENKIRQALGGSGYRIRKQDGTETDSGSLLPSAFFTIEKSGDRFLIHGGGYGHGIGMSQNGANEMAKKGKTYVEILQMFYSGVSIGDGEF